MNRRTFLRIAGMGGLSVAAGCTSRPEHNLYAPVYDPYDIVSGKATWYASTCRECPAGCGIVAKNRERRIVKVEGNPLHPINRGRLCIRGQAALQGVYNPDRIKTPLLKDKDGWRVLSPVEAEAILMTKAEEAAGKGENRVRMLTEVTGESLTTLLTESLRRWRSAAPLVFEPYGYEVLKRANASVFGVNGLPSYHLEQADFLISFGADFLETWLSPVEYAWKFKEMHALKGRQKALFMHVAPYQSMTGANADLWLSCKPGSEAVVALGLIRETLKDGRGKTLLAELRASVEKSVAPYTTEEVGRLSGINPQRYQKLAGHLLKSENPLVLGGGTGATGPNALQAQIAVNLLNVILAPELPLFDFESRHRIETAASRSDILNFFVALDKGLVDVLLLNKVNPVYTLPPATGIRAVLEKDSLFVVGFSNFMDETTQLADLIIPTALPLEQWDEYGGKQSILSTLQPTMASLTGAPQLGDVLLRTAFGHDMPFENTRTFLFSNLIRNDKIEDERALIETIQRGGLFQPSATQKTAPRWSLSGSFVNILEAVQKPAESEFVFFAAPSIRFFDGRGANRPWLCEAPDPLTRVAWQTPVLVNPESLEGKNLQEGDLIRIESSWGKMEAPVYETVGVRPGVLVMGVGQGHETFGRYAQGAGLNPFTLLPPEPEPGSGAPLFAADDVRIFRTDRRLKLAHMDGSRFQHGRKIALSVGLQSLQEKERHESHGLTMNEFPLTLPIPEGYSPERDFYLPHEHLDYRWVMVVDLDRCIGCEACVAACYAENNVGVVGLKRFINQREMAWIWIQRYLDPKEQEKVTFLPMLCQHCDNAPCESVCPVFAPHHSKEGLNNQIYNRCIGTRFCSQNCPYKARRFNWFDWQWPGPLHLQLNPDVTVRSKGVMEKCSFCIQRIKEAHGKAKDENRKILDGEIQPACVQTCPTGVFTFGNLLDRESAVRKKVGDKRAYQVMGYLNTKPGVIYLKKVVQEV